MSSCSVYGVGSDEPVDREVAGQSADRVCRVQDAGRARRRRDGRRRLPSRPSCATRPPSGPARGCASTSCSTTWWAWPGRRARSRMMSDGSPWRPLVHVLDIDQAVARRPGAPVDAVHGQIFNVGSNEQNYQVREIAEIVAAAVPGCDVVLRAPRAPTTGATGSASTRSARCLPGFACAWDARTGAAELAAVFAAHRPRRGEVHWPGLHPAGAAAAPDRDRAARRATPLDAPDAGNRRSVDAGGRGTDDLHRDCRSQGAFIVDLERREDERGFFARDLLPGRVHATTAWSR